ncbi:ATP-binding protein [Ohtaekwangia koreensis]|uniref:histidine kinase n=1 Tax=Ohtaekwangia koreensis TaxID=688867 RepID=A0A1T5M776_9BACT|nr:ATP-binding protein [Ohtaekwangia koreensis]SKC84080.1 Cyclic nucleotide-binding domain-containing protein [Ohtaekwangia koreensis]
MDILTALRAVPEFKDLAESHLIWLMEKGTVSTLKEGEKFFTYGDPIDTMAIVLEGEVDLYRAQGNGSRYLGAVEKGEITGLLPYSRLKTAAAEGIASRDSTIFYLHKDNFMELVREHSPLAEILVHTMTDRVRDFTHQQQQDDKMMALGKLSAGLAHELNNPSAAIVRSAQELKRHLGNAPEKFKSVIKIQTTADIVDKVNEFIVAKLDETTSQQPLSMMEKSEREDAMADWLQNIGLEDAYETASIFVDFHIQPEDMESLNKILRPEDRVAVINWIGQTFTTERLVNEIEEASRRINVLVTSVKSYTHMDRAPERERADLRAGIRNTLTMLNHKIKKNQVTVVENIPDNFPQPCIYVSAMNQVWTNLIDNALDALEGRPNATLEIKVEKDREFLIAYIIDNGPGIPADILDKIFDSFFTTKPIGKGTGIGLEVVRQIILQHNGKVTVKSEPGRTAFAVCIPID